MIDMADAGNRVIGIANTSTCVTEAWESFIGVICGHLDPAQSRKICDFRIEDDIHNVSDQIRNLIDSEPPPSSLNALYFGLYDTVNESGTESIGYYIAGIQGYDASDGDTLCSPKWWPEGRYLKSRALIAIKELELATSGDTRSLIAYAGQLGTALIVSKYATVGILPILTRVVGFDSGDIAEVS